MWAKRRQRSIPFRNLSCSPRDHTCHTPCYALTTGPDRVPQFAAICGHSARAFLPQPLLPPACTGHPGADFLGQIRALSRPFGSFRVSSGPLCVHFRRISTPNLYDKWQFSPRAEATPVESAPGPLTLQRRTGTGPFRGGINRDGKADRAKRTSPLLKRRQPLDDLYRLHAHAELVLREAHLVFDTIRERHAWCFAEVEVPRLQHM